MTVRPFHINVSKIGVIDTWEENKFISIVVSLEWRTSFLNKINGISSGIVSSRQIKGQLQTDI